LSGPDPIAEDLGREREPSPTAAPQPELIVEDGAGRLTPGQLPKQVFFEQLEAAVRNTAAEALEGTGWSAENCPYLNYWLRYYRARGSRFLERAIHKYAPDTLRVTAATDYIPLVTERVRRAITIWSATGEITEVPQGVPIRIPGVEPGLLRHASTVPSGVHFKRRDQGARPPADPASIQSQLGPGSSLEGGVRSRMETAFGGDFSAVRIHTDGRATTLASRLNARAFTVGHHVAFDTGEYRPGTIVGDALIAHELAHVLQQERASSPAASTVETGGVADLALEHDADRAAVSAVTALWSRGRGSLAGLGGQARAGLRSGLRLQRCDRTPAPASPTVDQITIVDSPTGAIAGYPDILGNADLNVPGPFNDPATGECKNVHQIHFHLDAGDSAGLTPTRIVTATATAAGANVLSLTDSNDGPPAHEIQRPSSDKIVIADAPGPRSLDASSYPFVMTDDFVLTVAASGTDVARIKYGVRMTKNSATDIPNTENRIFSTEKKDLVRNRDLA